MRAPRPAADRLLRRLTLHRQHRTYQMQKDPLARLAYASSWHANDDDHAISQAIVDKHMHCFSVSRLQQRAAIWQSSRTTQKPTSYCS